MRYVVTGGSGYIGSRLIEQLAAREDTERVVIADVRPPVIRRPGVAFEQVDVRDARRVREVIERERPDALVHLAFVLNPIHDEHTMYAIDVGGTQNVLEAAATAGTQHVLVTSSASAYGAFPDNPVPLTEEHPVRGVPDYPYARDKAESDRICQLWALEHPERTMTIVRPCIVFGPNVDNYIVRLWTKPPVHFELANELPLQFVHEDDVVEALMRLLEGRHAGAFNLAGRGMTSDRECAEILGVKRRRVPARALKAFVTGMWALHLGEAPPGNLAFGMYPWVISTDRLEQTLGWFPRHSSRETFEITMRAQGLLDQAPAGDPAAVGVPAGA